MLFSIPRLSISRHACTGSISKTATPASTTAPRSPRSFRSMLPRSRASSQLRKSARGSEDGTPQIDAGRTDPRTQESAGKSAHARAVQAGHEKAAGKIGELMVNGALVVVVGAGL